MANEKINRNTRQKAVILDYIKSNRDVHVRVEDILNGLKDNGESVGKTTVYRFLKVLEEEGQIRRYTLSDKAPACYQYIGDHPECRTHYHLMCSQCGDVMHVDSPRIQEFMNEMLENEGFLVDAGKTVFYGLCKRCRQNPEGE